MFHHGAYGTQFLPNEWDLTFRHLGNQIGVAHAVLLLGNALAMYERVRLSSSVEEIIALFVQKHHRFDDNSVRLQALDFGILVWSGAGFTDQQIANMRALWVSRHHGLDWNTAWTPNCFVPLDSFALVVPCPAAPPCMITVHDSPEHDPVPVVEETCRFASLRHVTCVLPGSSLAFRCSWTCDVDDLLAAFHHVWIVDRELSSDHGDLFLLPNPAWTPCMHDHQLRLLCSWDAQGLLILIQSDVVSPESVLFDQFGCLSNIGYCASQLCFGSKLPQVPQVHLTAISFICAIRKCTLDFRFRPDCASFVLSVCGPAHASQVVADFWTQALPIGLLDFLGLEMTRQASGTDFILKFCAVRGAGSLIFFLYFFIPLFPSFFSSLSNPVPLLFTPVPGAGDLIFFLYLFICLFPSFSSSLSNPVPFLFTPVPGAGDLISSLYLFFRLFPSFFSSLSNPVPFLFTPVSGAGGLIFFLYLFLRLFRSFSSLSNPVPFLFTPVPGAGDPNLLSLSFSSSLSFFLFFPLKSRSFFFYPGPRRRGPNLFSLSFSSSFSFRLFFPLKSRSFSFYPGPRRRGPNLLSLSFSSSLSFLLFFPLKSRSFSFCPGPRRRGP